MTHPFATALWQVEASNQRFKAKLLEPGGTFIWVLIRAPSLAVAYVKSKRLSVEFGSALGIVREL